MANIIKPKRTSVSGNNPTTSNLASGEIAVNMADKRIFINNGTSIVQIGAGFLSGLGDVSLSTLSAGQTLAWNGTAWTNSSAGAGDVVGAASSTDNAVVRFDGTTGKLIQNSVVTLDDTGNYSNILSQNFADGTAVTVAAGRMWYNGTTGSWNLGMGGGNITQQVGEELFVYGKASSAINDSPLQIIYQTGTVGASGVIQFAPTVSGITNGDLILGVATESIATNGFGRVTSFGVVHGITTNGTAYGETWADGDTIWYNPSTGNPTNVKPSAPNIKVQIGTLIKAGSGGSGSIQVEINHGSVLGGTDSNVQFNTLATGDLIRYNGTYWTNVATIPNSNLQYSSITINGTAISLGGSVSVGTVTSVAALTLGTTGTDLSSTVATGTTTPVITLNVPTASATNRGALSSTDWSTFNGKQTAYTNLSTIGALANGAGWLYNNGSGTFSYSTPTAAQVGAVPTSRTISTTAPLSGGGALSADLTLSMPAATTSASGYLTSTDWNTFNGKWTNGTALSATTGSFSGVLTPSGGIINGAVFNKSGAGGEGGELQLEKGATSTLSGNAVFDLLNQSIRFFDSGGTNKGASLDLSACATGVGSVIVTNTNISSYAVTSVPSKMIYDTFTATASQTTFTPSTTYTASKIDVYVNGVKMRNGTDVTVTSGTSVVFATGLAVGSLVDLVYPT